MDIIDAMPFDLFATLVVVVTYAIDRASRWLA